MSDLKSRGFNGRAGSIPAPAIESIVIVTDQAGSRISKVRMISKLKALDTLSKYFNLCNTSELSRHKMVVKFSGKFLNV